MFQTWYEIVKILWYLAKEYLSLVSVLIRIIKKYKVIKNWNSPIIFVILAFPFAAGIRAGYPAVLPGQYGWVYIYVFCREILKTYIS